MKNKYLLLIILVMLGCSHNKGKIVNLDQMDEVSVWNVFNKIEVIPLETSEESVIGEYSKLIYKNHKYFLLDEKQSALLIFNDSGKLVNKIQRVGKGPGEYIGLVDFEINPFTGDIELISPYGHFLIYSENGEFKRSFFLESMVGAVHYFKNLSKDVIVFYQIWEERRLLFYSRSQKKIIKTSHKIPENLGRDAPFDWTTSPFYEFEKKIYFYESFSNEVQYFKGTDLAPIFKWDFGKYNFDAYKQLPVGKSLKENVDFMINSNYAINHLANVETPRYLIAQYRFKKKHTSIFWEKQSQRVLAFRQFNEGITLKRPFDYFEGYLFSVIDPYYLHEVIKPELLDKESAALLNAVKIEDNPVIIKYHFK